jgi:uncharacterized repeat protein (TIGR03803 family)
MLIAAWVLIPIEQVRSQTITALYSFTGSNDGVHPIAPLVLSGSTLYGTLQSGGLAAGAVFRISTNGSGYTNLYSFSLPRYNPTQSSVTNSDGVGPEAGLVLDGTTLYGTANQGGLNGEGTIFRVNIDGIGFTNLHNFSRRSSSFPYTNSDGSSPKAELLLSSNLLYGVTYQGGSFGNGTIFRVASNGTGFTNLHNFSGTATDGALPIGSLILRGNTLYGTTYNGGSSGIGVVFKMRNDGSGFSIIHSFTAVNEGAFPAGALLESSGTLFGTTAGGGNPGLDTVFSVRTNGSLFTTLHYFAPLTNGTNADGSAPRSGVNLIGRALLGMTSRGGTAGHGTVFRCDTNGAHFTNVYNFAPFDAVNQYIYSGTNVGGAYPFSGLAISGNTLYGTAQYGGSSGRGTIFTVSLPAANVPRLGSLRLGENILLTWPTNAGPFALQWTSNLVDAASWTNVSSGPVIVNGLNTVTNPIANEARFFRLSE